MMSMIANTMKMNAMTNTMIDNNELDDDISANEPAVCPRTATAHRSVPSLLEQPEPPLAPPLARGTDMPTLVLALLLLRVVALQMLIYLVRHDCRRDLMIHIIIIDHQTVIYQSL